LDVQHENHLLIADDPGAFAAQTLRILNDAGLRHTLAENAFQLVREKYDWRQIGKNFRALVEDLAPGHER
jgi:glycosyltransferase involved in cell wall biosynthesis